MPDPRSDPSNVTQLLHDWRAGKQDALAQLMPLVEQTLHDIAQRQMRGENAGHTLQATALVNEAYMRLIDASVSWENRAHFLAVAARIMRRVLVDHAKAKRRAKRGGDDVKVTLHEAQLAGGGPEPDVLDLEDALSRLASFDERKANVVELSFYGGMTYDEIAEALDISPATVDRELRLAKAWLYRDISGDTT
ncbi:MAG: sigma-70 family RNA polymerase sigma factor [Pseudomonadota bacterium]|nr:MAG: sigma-70 family RNA polymerase sigma factor [Pseudomonadota bacterium]